MAVNVYLLLLILASASSIVSSSSDPGPLQDFCVATNGTRGVFVNGKFCKDPKDAKAEDFFLHTEPTSTDNELGIGSTIVTAENLPGLNTQGISMATVNYAPNGIVPIHTHPRASEILYCMEGEVYAAFVTSREDGYRLFSKKLSKGDVFVIPYGLPHFHYNIGKGKAAAIAFFNSQKPGYIFFIQALLSSKPRISEDVLARILNSDKKVIDELVKNNN